MRDKVKKQKIAKAANVPCLEVLPRTDIGDDKLIETILAKKGMPSLVADALEISMLDLMVRAKASERVKAAFAEARQRITDQMKLRAVKAVADGDTEMLKWYLTKYGD